MDLRQRFCDPLFQLDQFKDLAVRSGIGFEAWCGACEHGFAVMIAGSEKNNIPCMIFWHHILFVRSIMLFIHEDEPEISEGHEAGGTGPDHDLHFVIADFFVLAVFFGC